MNCVGDRAVLTYIFIPFVFVKRALQTGREGWNEVYCLYPVYHGIQPRWWKRFGKKVERPKKNIRFSWPLSPSDTSSRRQSCEVHYERESGGLVYSLWGNRKAKEVSRCSQDSRTIDSLHSSELTPYHVKMRDSSIRWSPLREVVARALRLGKAMKLASYAIIQLVLTRRMRIYDKANLKALS